MPIPGARDLLEGDLAALRQVQHRFQDFLSSWGYGIVDVPVLDRTDLYLRKLGSQVAALLFNLTDQRGDRLSLRPEFTGSVIRSYLRHAPGLPLPVRWQYCGPVFRDQGHGPDSFRQFTQLGAELIGAASPRADAELLALACKGLQELGCPRPRLVLGHAGLVPRLLKGFQISERLKLYIGRHLDLLREGATGMAKVRQGLEELQVLPPNRGAVPWTSLGELESAEASQLLRRLLTEGTPHPTGRRTPEEILRRFQAKLQEADDPTHLEQALALAADLAPLRAAPAEALAKGRRIITRYHLDLEPLQELQGVVELLAAYDLADAVIEVDLGLTRALGYYTGIVFEVLLGTDSARPVGGGGRYDGLVRALGGPQDVPALGFAYTLESLVEALPLDQKGQRASRSLAVLVVPAADSDLAEAIRYSASLRDHGLPATLEVMARPEEDRYRYCKAMGMEKVVLVSSQGIREIPLTEEVAPYAPAGAP